MGRSYWFECSRCGYRTTVSGRADRGFNFYVQTILCRECRQLYDAVIRLRVPATPVKSDQHSWDLREKVARRKKALAPAPTFQAALNLLQVRGVHRYRWQKFNVQCPVSSLHQIEVWNDPGPCPRCGLALEKNPLPYRIWD